MLQQPVVSLYESILRKLQELVHEKNKPVDCASAEMSLTCCKSEPHAAAEENPHRTKPDRTGSTETWLRTPAASGAGTCPQLRSQQGLEQLQYQSKTHQNIWPAGLMSCTSVSNKTVCSSELDA